jgi:predicted amidohydrolase YtcJ
VFAEAEMGRLAPGYRATFIVLADDILAVTDPHDIRECPVRMTVIDDHAVWNDDFSDRL